MHGETLKFWSLSFETEANHNISSFGDRLFNDTE